MGCNITSQVESEFAVLYVGSWVVIFLVKLEVGFCNILLDGAWLLQPDGISWEWMYFRRINGGV